MIDNGEGTEDDQDSKKARVVSTSNAAEGINFCMRSNLSVDEEASLSKPPSPK